MKERGNTIESTNNIRTMKGKNCHCILMPKGNYCTKKEIKGKMNKKIKQNDVINKKS